MSDRRTPTESRRPLLVGVDLPRATVRWHRELIDALGRETGARPVVSLSDGPPGGRGAISPFALFLGAEARITGTADDALERCELAETSAAAEQLDVLVDLGAGTSPRRDARYGRWHFVPSTPETSAGEVSLFWKSVRQDGAAYVELRSELPSGETVVIDRFRARLAPGSTRRNQSTLSWRCAERLTECTRLLAQIGFDALLERAEHVADDEAQSRLSNRPGLSTVTMHALRTARRRIDRARARDARERWFVALRRRDHVACLPEPSISWHELRPPEDRFYADPFLFEHGGETHLFVEDYRYETRRGVISHFTVNADSEELTFHGGEVVLECPYHLSYPQVFEHERELLMLLESRASRRIELWRAGRFPSQWEKAANLLEDVELVDPTLLLRDGRAWLFACRSSRGSAIADQLCVWSAPRLLGPYTAHDHNPVVSDVRRARPAGPFLDCGGQLYRPAQDGAAGYGRGVVFCRVLKLDDGGYREEPVARIDADWLADNIGSHTYAHSPRFEAIDGRPATPSPNHRSSIENQIKNRLPS